MLIPRFRQPKEPKYDLKAGKQIFSSDRKDKTVIVPKDTTNPIDVRLRQLALLSTQVNLVDEFVNKWACLERNHILYTGRIKDLYFSTRDIRIKTGKGEDIIGSFNDVIEMSEREL